MLQLKDITYSLVDRNHQRKTILNHVNLDFETGKCTVITGHNGSGKTTLVKIIMGIIQPDSGQIILDGEDITALNVTERAQKGIAFAFQQPISFKGLKVGDLLRIAHGGNPTRSDLCQYLSQVGICAAEYLDRELSTELSGGELKRIEIAMALLRNCRVTIFDEPEAGIDLWSFDDLIEIFTALKQKQRITILVSHQERVMRSADRLVLMQAGQVQQVGKPELVLQQIHCGAACQKLKGKQQHE